MQHVAKPRGGGLGCGGIAWIERVRAWLFAGIGERAAVDHLTDVGGIRRTRLGSARGTGESERHREPQRVPRDLAKKSRPAALGLHREDSSSGAYEQVRRRDSQCVARAVAAATVLVTLSSRAFAHDYWMEPTSFRPNPGQLVWISHFVGQRWNGDAVPREPDRIVRFFDRGPGAEMEVPGIVDPALPAGFLRSNDAGLHWIAYESGPSSVDLDATTFAKYLAEEGLDVIADQRAARGESERGVRELFSRCAKLALEVGSGGPHRQPTAPLGLTLEIVPERDVLSLAAGASLPVRVLFRGKPLAKALVIAREKGAPDAPMSVRTDAHGRAKLVLDHPGAWLVKVTAMEPADPDAGADWRSYWASMVFEVVER